MKSLVLAVAFVALPLAVSAQDVGPSTTSTPYVLPSLAGVKTTSILTVGDEIGGYRLVGIPDGLGAFRNTGGYFTLPPASLRLRVMTAFRRRGPVTALASARGSRVTATGSFFMP